MFLGASKVTLIEADEQAVEVALKNIQRAEDKTGGSARAIHAMVGKDTIELDEAIDVVVMNPPWGVQTTRADRRLLDFAFSLGAESVHILHSAKAKHVQAIASDHGYQGEIMLETEFRLPPTYAHHSKGKASTAVRCWRFHRPGDAKLIDEENQEA